MAGFIAPILAGLVAWAGIDNVAVPTIGDPKIREKIHAAYKAARDKNPETSAKAELGEAFSRLKVHWRKEKERLENPESVSEEPTVNIETPPTQSEDQISETNPPRMLSDLWANNKTPLLGGGAAAATWLMSSNPVIKKATGFLFVGAMIYTALKYGLDHAFNKSADRKKPLPAKPKPDDPDHVVQTGNQSVDTPPKPEIEGPLANEIS